MSLLSCWRIFSSNISHLLRWKLFCRKFFRTFVPTRRQCGANSYWGTYFFSHLNWKMRNKAVGHWWGCNASPRQEGRRWVGTCFYKLKFLSDDGTLCVAGSDQTDNEWRLENGELPSSPSVVPHIDSAWRKCFSLCVARWAKWMKVKTLQDGVCVSKSFRKTARGEWFVSGCEERTLLSPPPPQGLNQNGGRWWGSPLHVLRRSWGKSRHFQGQWAKLKLHLTDRCYISPSSTWSLTISLITMETEIQSQSHAVRLVIKRL